MKDDAPRPHPSPSVLVVVPVYNEAENLERLLGPLLEVVRREGYDLVAIDDASTDGSRAILERHGVPVVTLTENLGVGAALQTGYKYALAKRYGYLLQMDGDGQHDPRFLPMIRRRLACHDFVIGSRFLDGNVAPFPPTGALYKGTAFRNAGIRLFRTLLYAMSRVRVSDPTSGYRGMNRRCMRFLSGDDHPHDYPDADVLLALIRNRFRLCEEPVYMYRNHIGGKLHRGIMPVWYVCKVMLSMSMSGLRKRRAEPGGGGGGA